MKDHNLADIVARLIQSEKDIKSKLQLLLAQRQGEDDAAALQSLVKSKDGSTLELNKIFDLLN
ncbi:hypothetical protein HGA34_03865 [Candidatus Falkowbacteria bacterium]|nr:hypothetical protein [Candidatus Falkowbacteria bacterium]